MDELIETIRRDAENILCWQDEYARDGISVSYQSHGYYKDSVLTDSDVIKAIDVFDPGRRIDSVKNIRLTIGCSLPAAKNIYTFLSSL